MMGSERPKSADNSSNKDDKPAQSIEEEDGNSNTDNTTTKEEGKPSTKSDEATNDQKGNSSSIEALSATLDAVSLTNTKDDELKNAPQSIKTIAKMLSSKKHTKIIVLTGAGVSVNAGIPDFRTPGTGLYDNLQKYNLPFPEAVFDLQFYKRNPNPFVQLASELWPGLKHSPTITHSFIALLERKGMLRRVYTQNIDMLDVLAGVSEERMVECHGHFRTSSCTVCSNPFDGEECKRIIVEEKRAPSCLKCKGYVKPDIVFFGEDLPNRFHTLIKKDVRYADLLIVMGTSLLVSPVCHIPEMVRQDCPRVLFNRELVGTFCKEGMKSRRKSYGNKERDVFHKGDCDESIRLLCRILGWEEELDELNSSTSVGS